ncbi:MAG: hypothetical protein QOJ85_190 [Solirubrobacteraceae bacterium]|jgi:hypothetical protein|nr:hypothetical protein [Solirubrobacteraceae bacterium]
MKARPLIDIAILAAGILLAVVIYASRSQEKPVAAVAAGPAPAVTRAPDAAPRITQPPLVAVPALPPPPHRAKRPAARRPSAASPSPPARPARKPKTPKTRRSPLKQEPLAPKLLAPPD